MVDPLQPFDHLGRPEGVRSTRYVWRDGETSRDLAPELRWRKEYDPALRQPKPLPMRPCPECGNYFIPPRPYSRKCLKCRKTQPRRLWGYDRK